MFTQTFAAPDVKPSPATDPFAGAPLSDRGTGASTSPPAAPDAGVQELAQGLGDLLCHVMLHGGDSATAWLPAAAQAVHGLLTRVGAPRAKGRPSVAVLCSIAQPGPAGSQGPAWIAPAEAAVGYAQPEGASLLQAWAEQNATGSGPGTLARGMLSALMWEGCWTRRAVLTDDRWLASTFRQKREAAGLGEFVRLGVPISGPEQPRLLVVQVDALVPPIGQRSAGELQTAWPEERLLELLRLVGPYLQRSFNAQVASVEMRQRAVLGRVSPAQRQIVQELVGGLTEREVAKKLHRSPHTIHDHVKTIYAALDVSSRLELVELWLGRRELTPAGALAIQTPGSNPGAFAGLSPGAGVRVA